MISFLNHLFSVNLRVICFSVRSLNLDFKMAMQEERFSLRENSNHMVTITPFMGKLKVRIRQFYINGNGEMKPGKNGITLEIEEFYELVKLIPQVKTSIEKYELKDTGIPSSPLFLIWIRFSYHLRHRKTQFQSFEMRNF